MDDDADDPKRPWEARSGAGDEQARDQRIEPDASAPERILASASEVFHERSPASVSLREIARRAEVNYGLIHHYFGTKESVLAEVFRRSAQHGGELLADVADVDAALRLLARDPHAYARMLAWTILDSDRPEALFGPTPAMRHIRRLIERDWDSPEAVTTGGGEFDPRVVAATSVLVVLGWSLFAPFLIPAAELTDRKPEEINDEVLDLLHRLTLATSPAGDQGA